MRFEMPVESHRETAQFIGDIDEAQIDRTVEWPSGKIAVHAWEPHIERKIERPGILNCIRFSRFSAVDTRGRCQCDSKSQEFRNGEQRGFTII